MLTDVNNFLHSLALYLATATTLEYSGTPRALWRNQADEDSAGDPYSVLRIYGGPPLTWHPLPRRSIQCATFGTSVEAALTQAQKLFEGLLQADGTPQRSLVIPGKTSGGGGGGDDGHWKIVSIDPLQTPGIVGVDERNRHNVVFNFDVGFTHTA